MRPGFPKLIAGGLLLAGLAVPALSHSQSDQTTPVPAPQPSPPADSKPAVVPGQAPHPNRMRELIKGHENEPAGTVFKNVQLLKQVPAGRFLDAMEGFSQSLGTNCRKCHDTENFASDDKKEKQAARGMITMTRDINEKYIKPMTTLDQGAAVSCFTCHHGKSHPASRPESPGEEHEHHEAKP
jgi:hypothetical protein